MTKKKTEKAEKPKKKEKKPVEPAQPVNPDGTNRKHGDDGLVGHFVRVLKGEHTGRVASFEKVETRAKDGYPDLILCRSRDADNIYFAVKYDDVESAGDYHGGR